MKIDFLRFTVLSLFVRKILLTQHPCRITLDLVVEMTLVYVSCSVLS